MNINKTTLKCLLVSFLLILSSTFSAQQNVLIHSHNDYGQPVPFYQAYSQGVASIEADIYSTDKPDELLVAHDRHQLGTAPTLDESYIIPLINIFKKNNGRAWEDSDKTLILLIDLKTAVDSTLSILISKLSVYPQVFDPTVNPYAVRVVISGNRPDADTFENYPSFIFFDGSNTDYTSKQLKKIAMISLQFSKYAHWNGEGTMIKSEFDEVVKVIDKVHALGKPIRFWGTPDGGTAWDTFHNMGVDYINTDRPELCVDYFRNFDNL